jgi:thiamine-phosphate pyrophosphorylase
MSRPQLDLTLYLVTDPGLCRGLGVAETAARAAAAGATVVQLRDPDSSDDEFVRHGRKLRAALEPSGVPLIVNDRAHLVDPIGADGVHVGQHDLPAGKAREVVGEHRVLGLSVQSREHVARARELADGTVDYLGVGPVWAQATKPDAAEAGGAGTLAAVVADSPWPCVAIGGIDEARVGAVRRTGAVGVAVVSAICGSADVAEATRSLRRAWEEAG